jgi:hypothetical protein
MTDKNDSDHRAQALEALKDLEFNGAAPITHALLYIGDMLRRDTDLREVQGEY